MASLSDIPFAEALLSDGPHERIPPEQQIFAPFIGSWDLVVRWYDEVGKISGEERGEWHFAWILEGRGIQDVWIAPRRAERSHRSDLYEYGTSLRFFDEKIGAWQSTWIGPMHRVVRSFIARRIGEQVMLETTEGELPRMRWSFTDIQANAFSWRNELFTGDGWRVQQTFAARRMS